MRRVVLDTKAQNTNLMNRFCPEVLSPLCLRWVRWVQLIPWNQLDPLVRWLQFLLSDQTGQLSRCLLGAPMVRWLRWLLSCRVHLHRAVRPCLAALVFQ